MSHDYKVFIEVKDESDCLALQKVLDNLVRWCNEKKLFMNVGKLRQMSITRKNYSGLASYSFGDNIIETVVEHKDLGILFESNLIF